MACTMWCGTHTHPARTAMVTREMASRARSVRGRLLRAEGKRGDQLEQEPLRPVVPHARERVAPAPVVRMHRSAVRGEHAQEGRLATLGREVRRGGAGARLRVLVCAASELSSKTLRRTVVPAEKLPLRELAW